MFLIHSLIKLKCYYIFVIYNRKDFALNEERKQKRKRGYLQKARL